MLSLLALSIENFYLILSQTFEEQRSFSGRTSCRLMRHGYIVAQHLMALDVCDGHDLPKIPSNLN